MQALLFIRDKTDVRSLLDLHIWILIDPTSIPVTFSS